MIDKELFPSWDEEIQNKRENCTFYCDFSIADKFGNNAIKDTFNRAFCDWKDNIYYLTELCVALNNKCFYWHDKGDMAKQEIYTNFFYKARDYAYDNKKFTVEEKDFFWKVMD